ncbi:MAG TPA: copper chaperone PCu(A)C [Burkholderiaceae bacterium]
MKMLPVALFLTFFATASSAAPSAIVIDRAHARATVPGQTTGAAYVDIENRGKADDKLLKISSPVAQSAEVHSMTMDGTIMRMREVGQIDLKPAAKVTMAPNEGMHIMLIGLKQPLRPGQKIPLSLRFEKAGKIDVEAIVDAN